MSVWTRERDDVAARLWRLRRQAADRGFGVVAGLSLVVGLVVVLTLLVYTFGEARPLVSMRATAGTGLALSLRTLRAQVDGEERYLPYVAIAQVERGSEAYERGMRRGDALVAVEGAPVTQVEQVWNRVGRAPGGRIAQVAMAWVPRASELLGDLVAEPAPDGVGLFRVRVTYVPAGSPADRAGLRAGDLLLSAGGLAVQETRSAWESIVVAAQEQPGPVRIEVERNGQVEELLLQARQEGTVTAERSLPAAVWGFVSNLNEPRYPERAGLKSAILGSLYVILVMAAVAFPLGVGAAVYLEEYAPKNAFTESLEVMIANLAGVPSAIYGLIGLEVLARALNLGRSVLAGGITLGLLVLPIMIIAAREALRAVPPWVREAAYSLGATQWQGVRYHVLPYALPGILTGMILSLSRAIGEAAPLLLLGAFLFVTYVPASLLDTFTVVPLQIFDWATKPQDGFAEIAAAAILVLLAILFILNAGAIGLRNRYQIRW